MRAVCVYSKTSSEVCGSVGVALPLWLSLLVLIALLCLAVLVLGAAILLVEFVRERHCKLSQDDRYV